MRLKLWINAFIPETITGYTQVIPRGIHKGKTAVPLPGLARMNPGNTFKVRGAGYMTDQRSFDNSLTASHRMQSLAEIELSPPALGPHGHSTSGTTEVNMASGAVHGSANADMSRCAFSGFSVSSPAKPGQSSPHTAITLQLTAAGADPLVWTAADIDYKGTFTIKLMPAGRIVVDFDGLIDAFPAFECYAMLGDVTKTLFNAPPPPGNTVLDLPGNARRPISGIVSFP